MKLDGGFHSSVGTIARFFVRDHSGVTLSVKAVLDDTLHPRISAGAQLAIMLVHLGDTIGDVEPFEVAVTFLYNRQVDQIVRDADSVSVWGDWVVRSVSLYDAGVVWHHIIDHIFLNNRRIWNRNNCITIVRGTGESRSVDMTGYIKHVPASGALLGQI